MTAWSSTTGNTSLYAYNGLGLRVSKSDGTGSFTYLYDGAEPGSSLLSDYHATYTAGLSENRNGVNSYLHGDILGSLRLTTVNQSITDTLLYSAFGETVTESSPKPLPLKFVGGKGYQWNGDSKLELLGADYDIVIFLRTNRNKYGVSSPKDFWLFFNNKSTLAAKQHSPRQFTLWRTSCRNKLLLLFPQLPQTRARSRRVGMEGAAMRCRLSAASRPNGRVSGIPFQPVPKMVFND